MKRYNSPPDRLSAPIVTVAPTLTKLLALQAEGNLKPIDLAPFLAAAQMAGRPVRALLISRSYSHDRPPLGPTFEVDESGCHS